MNLHNAPGAGAAGWRGSLIEPLECRIAPAVLLNPTTVTYTDVDGDLVTVTTSSGTFDLAANFTFAPSGLGEQLQRITFGDPGASLFVLAEQAGDGNGRANVGHIDAQGTDLAAVGVSGDLGRIEAGDADLSTPGLELLLVRSIGRQGIATQPAGDGDLTSNIAGDLLSLKVRRHVMGALVSVAGEPGGAGGKIGTIEIGGSLLGDSTDESGLIRSTGAIGSVLIEGDIVGGAGADSGGIVTDRSIAQLVLGGSLKSGTGEFSGAIRASGRLGTVEVAGGLLGNNSQPALVIASGPSSDSVDALSIQELKVAGDVAFAEILAGYSPEAVPVNGDGRIGKILVGGNWTASSAVAGATSGNDGLFGTADDVKGFPDVAATIARIAKIKIGGTAAGTGEATGDHFGFVAEEIVRFTLGGVVLPLQAGPGNDSDPADAQLAIGTTGDLRIMEVSSSPPPELLAAVSRKTHGAAGAFDINLPLAGAAGLESRAGEMLTLVFTFDHAVASGSAAVTSGTGAVNGTPSFVGNQMIVSIAGVADVQTLVVSLTNVTDTAGGVLPSAEVGVAVLQADVNSSRSVNTSDTNTVRAASTPGTVNSTSFRSDIDLSGLIDSTDVAAVQSKSGNQLP